jgi:hypothetical protein
VADVLRSIRLSEIAAPEKVESGLQPPSAAPSDIPMQAVVDPSIQQNAITKDGLNPTAPYDAYPVAFVIVLMEYML